MNKKKFGQYFTKKQYWRKNHVMKFLYKYKPIFLIDPFAGEGDMLNSFSKKYIKLGVDIDKSLDWEVRDSLIEIKSKEKGFIVTNPPYLSKASSSRRMINHKAFANNCEDNLYKIALNKMFDSKMPGIAIIPESFINSSFSKKHIYSITILIPNPFKDTDVPVCIVCFDPNKIFKKTKIYRNEKYINTLESLKQIQSELLKCSKKHIIKFNNEKGQLALIAYDGINGKRIRFINAKNLIYNKKIKISSRVVTVIDTNILITDIFIKNLNNKLEDLREKTNDVLLTPFKGNDNFSNRRRRLDFATARQIINSTRGDL